MNLRFALVVLSALRVSVASLDSSFSITNATLLPPDVKAFYDYLDDIENETETPDRRMVSGSCSCECIAVTAMPANNVSVFE